MGKVVALHEAGADEQFEAWLAEGRELADRHRRNLWDIGDWWSRGEHAYGDRARLAVEAFAGGYSYGALRNIGSVAKRIEPSRRRDSIPFWTHAEIAQLDAAPRRSPQRRTSPPS